METLEHYCAEKVRVMRNVVFSEQDNQCRNCNNPRFCKDYIPYNPQSEISRPFQLNKEGNIK